MHAENHHINIQCASVICKQLFSHTYSCSHTDNQWFVDDIGEYITLYFCFLSLFFSNRDSICRTDQFNVSSLKFDTQDFTDPGLLKIRRILTGLSLWVLPSQVWVNIPKRKFRTELMHFSQSSEENVWMGSFGRNWKNNCCCCFFFLYKKKIFWPVVVGSNQEGDHRRSPGVSDYFEESRLVEPAQVPNYISPEMRISILPRIWHYKIIYSEFVRP